MIIATSRDENLLIVSVNNPPVNALGHAVRAGLVDAIRTAAEDPAIAAIVLCCEGRTFFAGADISEFGKPSKEPSLRDVCEVLEASEKPVVAAIHGTALGGGLEVALACHYRIALSSAKLGLPEVNLGILPGAGGTQRLPRLVGLGPALELITSGKPTSAALALGMGLVDRIAERDVAEAAKVFARTVASLRPLPRISERNIEIDEAEIAQFAEANARNWRGFDAPAACLKAIAAAAKPFWEGMEVERRLFLELLDGSQSKALRHYFFAERTAAKVDGLAAGTRAQGVLRVGIIGAGTMGGGIAMNFLSAGIPVTLVERDQAALDRGVSLIERNYAASVAKGRMSELGLASAMSLLRPTINLHGVEDCDLVIEAVFEDMAIKKSLFAELDRFVRSDGILASNTSYLDVDELARATTRPERVIGLHFFSPANVMKLLEVVRGAKTSDEVLATAMALAKTMGKIAVVAGVAHGFIGNRMLQARQKEAQKLILEGAMPSQVDGAITGFGMPMGPFQMSDLAGLDIGWHRDPTRKDSVREILCAEGRFGQKAGAGFYDYDDKRRPTVSAFVETVVRDFAAAQGIARRDVGDEEILERCLYPMVNEGCRILEEGKAQRASDIDVVWVNGYGWPRWRGGPMFWGESVGFATIHEALVRLSGKLGLDFRLSPLLTELAHSGASIFDWKLPVTVSA